MQADKGQVTRLLKTARGQLDGILKMVEEDRYCMDISNQVLATSSILSKINQEILRAHMQNCLAQALSEGDETAKQRKIEEMMDVLAKIAR